MSEQPKMENPDKVSWELSEAIRKQEELVKFVRENAERIPQVDIEDKIDQIGSHLRNIRQAREERL